MNGVGPCQVRCEDHSSIYLKVHAVLQSMCCTSKYVLYFKVCAVLQSTALKAKKALKAMKNVLQKTYFKNVLKDGFIDPHKRYCRCRQSRGNFSSFQHLIAPALNLIPFCKPKVQWITKREFNPRREKLLKWIKNFFPNTNVCCIAAV